MCGDVQACPGPGNCTRNLQELNSLIKTRGIKISHQNARGLSGNFGHVAELLQSFPGMHILSLSETHIEARSDQEDGVYDIPGYSFISRPRKSGKGGGVGAYILDGISWDRRDDLENENIEAIWLEVRPSHSNSFLLCIMYRPPESFKYLSKDFNTHLHEMLAKASEKSQETILLGDLNVDFLKHDNKDLKSILNIFGYKQMIQKPTRIAEASETLIDVILTNKPSNVVKTEVIPTGIGDHDMVGCARKINHLRFKPRQIICRDYKSYKPEAMNKDLEAVDWTYFYSCRHVNEAWSIMKSILTNIFDRHAPKLCKNIRGQSAPWLSSDVKKLMNDRDKLLRKSRRTKDQLDISQYKRKRNEVNIAIRKARSSYHKNMLKENSGNPNKFWKSLKTIYPTKSTTGPSMHSFDIDGIKTDDPARISNAFCSFFATVTSKLRESAIPLRDFVWRNPAAIPQRTDKQIKFRPISKLEVERELRSIKRTKSTGIDNLPPGLLKDAACFISAPLAHLINLSLETGIFPTDMKIAKIVPVHKSGSLSSFDNYRPISILPVLSKVIEKLVQRQLMEFLDKNKLLSKFQFGFRPRLSTELAATLLLDEIRKNVDQGKLVGATFIDLSKAFDTISHSNLLQNSLSMESKRVNFLGSQIIFSTVQQL